ncbi:MAG: DNA repair protein RadC [Candidatus ainarchaeum sp.]|nr:DNA repair protein RadC [Candidatus ainarchaeum sp.]
MKIKDLPEQNRPRERFLKQGAEALSDAELFAIILRTGTITENVIDMSNRLIKEYGLDKLFECSLKELQKIKGIGPSKAMQILAISELGKRHNQSKKTLKQISSAKEVFNLFHERLKDEKQENFYVLMLNNKNYIIKEELITKGILDSTIIHPREIFKPAIKNSSARIILVHNHPSGDPAPSEEDVKVTQQIKEASKVIGIELADHIIIGTDNYYSFKQKSIDF